MLPSVFDAVVFEANQFHDTKVFVLELAFPLLPKLKPSLSNEVTKVVNVSSASEVLV